MVCGKVNGCGKSTKIELVCMAFHQWTWVTLQWVEFVRMHRADIEGPYKFTNICSDHFTTDDTNYICNEIMGFRQRKLINNVLF